MSSTAVPPPPCGGEPCASLLRNLAIAVDSRDVIGMAKGLLMATDVTMTPDAAFAVLSHASQRENRKLRAIAEEMVGRRVAAVEAVPAIGGRGAEILLSAREAVARAGEACDDARAGRQRSIDRRQARLLAVP